MVFWGGGAEGHNRRGCLVETPPPQDGYCCGRYASYWNAFLFITLNFVTLLYIKISEHEIPFSSGLLFIYFFQLALSIVMYIPEVRENGFTMPPFSFALPFVVPSIVYFVNNNLSVQAQVHMDPATYQVRKRLF